MGNKEAPAPTTTTTTETPDWTITWSFWFFQIDRPGGVLFIGGVSIVHSIFHVPHLLMYRRLGILTAFWSVVGVGLVLGALMDKEWLYDVWIWYSCVYVPMMLIIMCIVLTASVWALNLKPFRAILATVAVLFYLIMFYCIVYVQSEKRRIFTTTTPTTTTTTPCPWCPTCTTPICTATTTKATVALRTLQMMLLGDRRHRPQPREPHRDPPRARHRDPDGRRPDRDPAQTPRVSVAEEVP